MDWKPIETAPTDGTRVLLYADMPEWNGAAYEVSYWDPEAEDWEDIQWEPTHWCALQPPSRDSAHKEEL